MIRNACLFVLALPMSLLAVAAQAATPASAPQARAAASAPRGGVACPAASAPRRLGAASSKGRHVPDENDPCADSRGAVAPAHAPAPSQ